MSGEQWINGMIVVAQVAAAVCGVVSAIYWQRSATASVPPDNTPNEDGWISASVSIGGADIGLTMQEQSRLNAIAARWAAGAAIGVAAYTFLSVLS